jgi:methanogenic corrinoid protein MtbC1
MSILKPIIQQSGKSIKKTGKVVIGTVKTDIHEIGKNIVASMLATAGFEIWDLRADVSALDFIKKAEEVNADTIALSALMTTTMPYQKDVIDLLTNMSLRDKYRVVVGGGAVNQEWANQAVEISPFPTFANLHFLILKELNFCEIRRNGIFRQPEYILCNQNHRISIDIVRT